MKRAFDLGIMAALVLAAALALVPSLDRAVARREARRQIAALEGTVVAPRRCVDPALLALGRAPLASWASVGGCGAGGGSASAPGGGIKWVGRNVTGGLVDVQCFPSQTYASGNHFTTINTRVGTTYGSPWGFGLYVPVLYKVGDVVVLGQTKTARIAGFGDVSLEVSRRLGVIGAHQLTLNASVPTGAADAVRQGVVLPQRLQLGSGVLGATAQYEHTQDRDWGLVITGGTISYGGWENDIGDYRAPSATAYAYAGYVRGPLVPSAGLLFFGKPVHDKERGAPRPNDDDPLFLAAPSLGLEWSSDWLALFFTATVGLSYTGFESATVGLGVSSSVF